MSGPSLEDPDYRKRLVRTILVVSPLGFLIAYGLGRWQGGSQQLSVIMGAILFAGCLAAAALFHFRGSKAGNDVLIIRIILALLRQR